MPFLFTPHQYFKNWFLHSNLDLELAALNNKIKISALILCPYLLHIELFAIFTSYFTSSNAIIYELLIINLICFNDKYHNLGISKLTNSY